MAMDIDAASLVRGGAAKIIPVSGKAEVITESEILPVQNMEKAYLDELAFMEEPVTIMVMEPQDEKESKLIQLHIRGRPQFIIPGEVVTIRRKYLGVLAMAKQLRYKMVVKRNEYTGAPINKMIPKKVLRYNFSVIHDPNPKGAEWLRNMLAS